MLWLQDEIGKVTTKRLECEACATELQDLLNSNLLKRQQELTKRLQLADVEADRSVRYTVSASPCCALESLFCMMSDICPCIA